MATMAGRLFVFAGGGTGGHLAPGLAVAAELRRREPDCRIRFVGSGRPIEQQMLGDTDYEIVACDVQPLAQLRRRPFRMLRAHWNAYQAERRCMQTDRPAAVIGLGGYASLPSMLAAKKERIPGLLLEQNAIAGRATRLLARWFPVCTTFAESVSSLPRAAIVHVTGNPLRPELIDLARTAHAADEPSSPDAAPQQGGAKRTLLVLGGSQGSREVNSAVLAAAEELAATLLSGWRVIHQTGPDDVAIVRSTYDRLGIEHVVEAFFGDLSSFYRDAGLCVSRAGATTLSELAAAGVPAILIPYPQAADDHQRFNANVFKDVGAAIVTDPDSAAADVTDSLRFMLADSAKRDAMRIAMSGQARIDAAVNVVDLLTG